MVVPNWAVLLLGFMLGAVPVRWYYETKIAKAEQVHADDLRQQSEAARKREKELGDQIEEVRAQGRQDDERVKADSFAAGVASVGLRGAATTTAARAHCPASDPAGSKAAKAASDLLADVLARLDDATGEIARAADERRDAGLRCERTLEALKNPSK